MAGMEHDADEAMDRINKTGDEALAMADEGNEGNEGSEDGDTDAETGNRKGRYNTGSLDDGDDTAGDGEPPHPGDTRNDRSGT